MREKFSDGQLAEFLRRSYFVVDGLWFVKTEERDGFDAAMDLDEAVWQVMSKVQARKAREIMGLSGGSLADLARAFQLKLTAEGYDYEIDWDGDAARLSVGACPWFEILKTSGRTQIAEVIANRICAREFAGWTAELAPDVDFEILGRLCVEADGCSRCSMVFRRR